MITKRAVRKFLERDLADHREMKEWSDEELDAECQTLPIRPPIWSKLRKHQKVCFLLGAKYGRFAYWLDTGTGKTLLSISLARYFDMLARYRKARQPKFLVLVPTRVNRAEWIREIKKHSPKTKYEALVGSSDNKWQILLETDALLYLITYGGLPWMVSDIQEGNKKSTKAKKRKPHMQPNKKVLRQLVKQFDGVIMDESSEVQNPQGLPFRVLRQVCKEEKVKVFELSGTPFGRDPISLWAQMYLVDKGDTLGRNLGIFRAAFFKSKVNYFSGFPEYTFDKKKKPILHRMLANRSIRYEINNADLPKVIRIEKECRLPASIEAYYLKARRALLDAKGNIRETENAFLRMRQLSSGFLGYKDDAEGARAQFEFSPNPKLDLCLDLLDRIVDDYKVVVYYEFLFSGKMIGRELKAMGIPFAKVDGTVKDTDAELNRFVEKKDCRVLLMSSAGAYGLNLQMAKYLLFFESPIRPIIRKQVERRVERQGSEHDKVFIYDLIGAPVDLQILDWLDEGRDLFKGVIDGRAKVAA